MIKISKAYQFKKNDLLPPGVFKNRMGYFFREKNRIIHVHEGDWIVRFKDSRRRAVVKDSDFQTKYQLT